MKISKRRLIVGLVILLSLVPGYLFSAPQNKVTKGVLDLRYLQPTTKFSMTMNGEWEFYYERFLNPADANEVRIPDAYSVVPSYWTKTENCSKKIRGTGFGTYRCIVLLPPGYDKVLGFDVPSFTTSYEMSINGTLISFNGKPGKTEFESVPKNNPLFVKYFPKSDTLDIIIKVSNFEQPRGGFSMPMKIGSFTNIQESFSNQWIISIATTSMLFSYFVFFFIFYLINRSQKKILAFSIITLALAIIPIVSAPYLITLITTSGWTLITRIRYLNLFLLVLSSAVFLNYLYPSKFSKILALYSAIIFAVATILILTTNTRFFANLVSVVQVSAIIIICNGLFMSFKGAIKLRLTDLIYFIAFLMMAFGTSADIMLANGLENEQHVYIMSSVMLVCVFLQSILLIKEWGQTTREKENLNVQLQELTRTLEEKVSERTLELTRKSSEIESQNNQIKEQNKKFSDIIHVKNQIFALISHDLRSPVVNILYGLNLIKEDKNGEHKEWLTNSCIQNSQMVINLLENMLVWGRDQEDMIRFSPGYYDLADTILTNMSIYKESADRKNIRLNFTQIGDSKGWFDKDLMDIIIRNLISNAIKFTNQNGRVTILLKEAHKPDDSLIISITDNGVGIPRDKLETLFSGKSIQSTYGTENEKGTGIGLKLVSELIKICNGNIKAESSPDEGTSFTVTLPDIKQKIKKEFSDSILSN